MTRVFVNLPPPPATELTRAALRRFNDIDVMKRGVLSLQDIRNNLFSTTFRGIDGAMLATLYTRFCHIEDFSDDELGPETNGITRADLVALDRIMASDETDEARHVVSAFETFSFKIRSTGSALFVGAAVNPFATEQGGVGDCWFLAALVALKVRADKMVRTAIQQSGSGFSVTFPGAASPMPCVAPNDQFIALLASTNNNGLWLTVMELAFGCSVDMADPIKALDTGGLVGFGLHLVTGNKVETDDVGDGQADSMRTKLEAATDAGKAIVVSIKGQDSEETPDGWPVGHAYTVLDYSKEADELVIRNPWRNDGPTGKTVALKEFRANFTTIAYEQ
jgi:hypothetical protein